jgi:hypothetical protein
VRRTEKNRQRLPLPRRCTLRQSIGENRDASSVVDVEDTLQLPCVCCEWEVFGSNKLIGWTLEMRNVCGLIPNV